MRTKKFLLLITTVILAVSLSLTGCSNEVDRDKELTEAQETIHSELTKTFNNESLEFDLLSEYLKAWASNTDTKVSERSNDYIILSNPATKGNKKNDSTAFQCSIDVNDCEKSLNLLSTGMTALLGPNSHGKLSLIVTKNDNGHKSGAEAVPAKYLDVDNLINMQNGKDISIYTQGAYASTGTIYYASKETTPKYSECYKITMSMPEYTDPFSFDKKNNYPNPIETIGSLLASTKSSGKLFEISSFTSSSHEGYTPYSASVTLVIDSNNVEGFKKKFDKSFENTTKKFDKLEKEFVYTMTKSKLPKKVLSEKTTNNLISLMYTLNTGNCIQDEDSGIVYATSYIRSLTTNKGKLQMNIKIRARNEESLNELTEIYETTAGLCNTKYTHSPMYRIWSSNQDSKLDSFFLDVSPIEDGDSDTALKTYDNDFFYAKNKTPNIITIFFSKSDSDNVLLHFIHFTDPQYKDDVNN